MATAPACIVTRKEALQLLGLRATSIDWLERMAHLERLPRRQGYSGSELRKLLAALKTAVGAHD